LPVLQHPTQNRSITGSASLGKEYRAFLIESPKGRKENEEEGKEKKGKKGGE
jgi:hypothetical protein